MRQSDRTTEWPSHAGTEIEINHSAEPKYRQWIKERTTRWSKPLYYEEAIYGGAESVGISPTTTRRYLAKMTSPQGDFLLVRITEQGRNLRQIVYKRSLLKQRQEKLVQPRQPRTILG